MSGISYNLCLYINYKLYTFLCAKSIFVLMDTVTDYDSFSSSDGTDSDDSTPGSVTDRYSSSDDDIDNVDGGPQNMPGFQLQPV